jgi:hypothetical protein
VVTKPGRSRCWRSLVSLSLSRSSRTRRMGLIALVQLIVWVPISRPPATRIQAIGSAGGDVPNEEGGECP